MDEENAMAELSAAWDEAEANEDVPRGTIEESNEPTNKSAEQDTTAGLQEPESADSGGGADDAGGIPGAEDEAEAGEEHRPDDADAEIAAAAKPPASWNATAREKWKDIPKEAQDYIQTREAQMQQGMQKNAQQAQRAQQMDKILSPFSQYLSMGGQPSQTIKQLLQTGASLQMGTPVQRAQMITNLIKQFDVDISTLDNMLVGSAPPPEVAQQQDIQQQINAAFQAREQQQQQYAYQQEQAQAGQTVQQFAADPKNEFYNDVSGQMIMLLDGAASNRQHLSLDDAYSMACRAHPEINKIIQSRQQVASLSDKRRAATSIAGSPGGPGGTNAPSTMYDALSDAWDRVGRT